MDNSTNQMVTYALLLVAAWLLLSCKPQIPSKMPIKIETLAPYQSKKTVQPTQKTQPQETQSQKTQPQQTQMAAAPVTPYTGDSLNMNLANTEASKIDLGTCANMDGQFLSSSLLPSDTTTDESFSEFSPANMEGKNFIDSAKYLLGTSSGTTRNANLQLRSEPPNPTDSVCAWNNTTINPDLSRRPLEIGTSN